MADARADIRFQILFDEAAPAGVADEAFAAYGNFSLPPAPPGRPWIYSNFVQSLDGMTSLLGEHASGGEISQSREDRWLMDLLRAHADGIVMGMNTLLEERRNRGPESRGIVFRVADPELRRLRTRLGKPRERNIFVTHALELELAQYRVFDGEEVDAVIVTSPAGAGRLRAQAGASRVSILACGESEEFDVPAAMKRLREELGIEHLLCEGGPTLYGSLARLGLIDEKFVTISPVEVGQIVPPEQERLQSEQNLPVLLRPTVFAGPGFTRETMTRWKWISSRRAGNHEFNRYRRIR